MSKRRAGKKEVKLPVSAELLDVLACPDCHGELQERAENAVYSLYCARCDQSYPVEDGILIMLPPELRSPSGSGEGEELSSVKWANISFYVNKEREREKWKVHPSKAHSYPRLLDFTIRHFSRPGMKVLDACCGVGMVSSYLHQRGLKPFSFDISRDSVRSVVASDSNLKNLFVADAENMSLRPESFDGVCYYASLHHLPDPYRGITESYRVLKPGGKLILIEPNNISIGVVWGVMRAMLRLPVRPRQAIDEFVFTFKKSLAELSERGTIEHKGKRYTRDTSGRWIGVAETDQEVSLPHVLRLAKMAGFGVVEVRTQRIALKLVTFFDPNISSETWRRLQQIDQMILERVPVLNRLGDLMLVALQKQ